MLEIYEAKVGFLNAFNFIVPSIVIKLSQETGKAIY